MTTITIDQLSNLLVALAEAAKNQSQDKFPGFNKDSFTGMTIHQKAETLMDDVLNLINREINGK